MGKRDEWACLREALERSGFSLDHLPSGHYGVFNDRGVRVYTMGVSPGDNRAYMNARAQIKRILGVDIPHKNKRRKKA
jgi:hypothetical protein